ncbi:hypothetical protein AGLY_016371, partial [Aphis glycines]
MVGDYFIAFVLLSLLSQHVSLFFYRNRTVHRLLMMDNQRATSSSTFQPQQTGQPSVESLLFNDIIEEKSQILSNLMNQFLQVQPFSKFESEFNVFLRRIKHITREEQRKGTYRHLIQIPSDKDTQTENDVSPENNRPNIESFNQDQSNCSEKSEEKTKINNLTNWSINLKEIKSNKGISKSFALPSRHSTLLARDQITELKKVHKAGVLVARKSKNIIKTDRGLYHLIGSITEGSPLNLFRACIGTNGIPKTWRSFLMPLKTKIEVNVNESVTRKGTIYNKEKKASHNVPETEEFFEEDLPCDLLNGLNNSDFRQQLLQLSALKTTKSFGGCQTPSQILKHKFHRKFVKACLIIGSLENTVCKVFFKKYKLTFTYLHIYIIITSKHIKFKYNLDTADHYNSKITQRTYLKFGIE